MDIKFNSVSFNGKNEVIYGIKKLADESANYELKRAMTIGAHPVNMSNSISESQGKLFAYADMIVNDELIDNSLKEISNDKVLIKYCKKVLTQESQQFISPINIFVKSLKNAAKNMSQNVQDSLNEFVSKIK